VVQVEKIEGTWKDTNNAILNFCDTSVAIDSNVGYRVYFYRIEEGNKLYIPGWWDADDYYIIKRINDEKIELIKESGDIYEILIKH
jgi:hypothetical protein